VKLNTLFTYQHNHQNPFLTSRIGLGISSMSFENIQSNKTLAGVGVMPRQATAEATSTTAGIPSATPMAGENNIGPFRRGDAPQTNNPNAWYNPLPTPYAYGQFPTNGGNIYNNFAGGFYGSPGFAGGLGAGGFAGGFGGGFGGIGTAQPVGNVWGGYDITNNNNPNGPLPGYGYSGVVSPSVFQTPLSGNGTAPLLTQGRVYQELYVERNNNAVHWGIGAGGAAFGAMATHIVTNPIWRALPLPRFVKSKLGPLVTLTGAAFAGLAATVATAPWVDQTLKQVGSSLDWNDNGRDDGSIFIQNGDKLDFANATVSR
jgi:hypothetical protein